MRKQSEEVEETLRITEVQSILKKREECKLRLKEKYPGNLFLDPPEFDSKKFLVGARRLEYLISHILEVSTPDLTEEQLDIPECDSDLVDLHLLEDILLHKYCLGKDDY